MVYSSDPAGELADNALYWIGGTYYETGKFNEAARVYDRLLENFPAQNKAPDAMFRKALTFVQLGDLALARQVLESLIDEYPYSTAAVAAKRELERIRY